MNWQPSYGGLPYGGGVLCARRVDAIERLPLLRAVMLGPRWEKCFEVRRARVVDVAPESARFFRRNKKIRVFTFEPEIRERILDELRPGVFAQWSDPYEQFGLRRSA